MHLNIDQNVNEKAPEIAFPMPLTGELRLKSAKDALAKIGTENVRLSAGIESVPIRINEVASIVVIPSAPGMVNVTFSDAIAPEVFVTVVKAEPPKMETPKMSEVIAAVPATPPKKLTR